MWVNQGLSVKRVGGVSPIIGTGKLVCVLRFLPLTPCLPSDKG